MAKHFSMYRIITAVLLTFFYWQAAAQDHTAAEDFHYLDNIKQELSKKHPANRTINLIFHGHSVPSGYWARSEVHTLESYPYLLLEKIKAAYPYAVVNIITTSIGGEFAERGAARFDSTVLIHQPDVLFIDYALNDIGVGLKRSRKAWAEMIRKATDKGIKVILLTPSPDLRYDLTKPESPLALHAAQIRSLSAEYKVGLANPFSIFSAIARSGDSLGSYMSHVNHPNKKGHEIIANCLFNYFDPQPVYPKLGSAPLDSVIAAMTTREKALMVTGAKRREVYPQALPGKRQKNITAVGGYTYPFPHLGIPPVYLCDGPAGVRIAPRRSNQSGTFYATAFPVATLVASSWDTSLARELGAAMGYEAREYGVDILLAPAMNIHRDPLGGRSFEYYSEDPLVTGKMAAAVVNGIQSEGVGTSIKHFAANNQETNRRTINTVLSERALREIYLEGYRIAVKESKPWTVMSSYNKINGIYTAQSPGLLTDILRKEWGFDGFVLTDWYGGDDAVEQIKAQNDLLMPGLQVWSDSIEAALERGSLPMQTVDNSIRNILKTILKTATFRDHAYSDRPDFTRSREIARRAANESMVLLKNEAVLPFSEEVKNIGLFGNYSYKNLPGGTGSGAVNYEYAVSIADGLEAAGYGLDGHLKAAYLGYLELGKPMQDKADSLITAMPKRDSILAEWRVPAATIIEKARSTDIGVITIMRIFGEGGDRKIAHFKLTVEELRLIDEVSAAYHAAGKKVVVVLNTGGVVETASWKNKADALVLAWQNGQEGGHALADILSGKVNPSGKLATTFPISYEDVPSARNFPGTPANNPSDVFYEEDIYVGYRYYTSFKVPVSFPFGYGLSYTKFTYSDLAVVPLDNKHFKVRVTITNTGNKAGREVAQLYITAPRKKIAKPALELKGFGKTPLLPPGKSATLEFEVTPRTLSSFHTDISAWKADKGVYRLLIGSSSEKFELTGTLRLTHETIAETVNKVLSPQAQINTFRP